jgi:hypothetical protein
MTQRTIKWQKGESNDTKDTKAIPSTDNKSVKKMFISTKPLWLRKLRKAIGYWSV